MYIYIYDITYIIHIIHIIYLSIYLCSSGSRSGTLRIDSRKEKHFYTYVIYHVIYIYIERERERDSYIYICIYYTLYINICVFNMASKNVCKLYEAHCVCSFVSLFHVFVIVSVCEGAPCSRPAPCSRGQPAILLILLLLLIIIIIFIIITMI